MFQRLNRILLQVSKWSAWGGMLLLLGAVFATTADILARKLFSFTYQGTIDVVQLLVLSAAFLSIPYAFISRSHVAVAIFADKFSDRWRSAVSALAAMLSTGIMFAFGWFGINHASMQIEYGDVSQTIGIPIVWFWIPVVYSCFLSGFITLVMSGESLYKTVLGEEALP
ncbi:MAG: TRAP transporter small permease [Sedimenticola sp.]|nr:TRAP transporter small permease [Sedimenticola sp.]MCW8946435.1 TRAP transporter small permease [Sedimenticola sp.]MCW8949486.1 TRAP transporter small permease [Sedimenticola sp.]MCW8976839.1 TRAP transporter small permease [Sedimenticola sp.]